MNISIPIIKSLTVIAILIISSLVVSGYINTYKNDYSNKVVSIDTPTAKNIFKEILNNIYLTNNEEYIKIINLGQLKINIEKIGILFSIRMPNETMSWKLDVFLLCFSNVCNGSINQLYTINTQPIKEENLTLIPTLNIQFNITNIGIVRIYNFFISTLKFNNTYILSGENSIKIDSKKNVLLITRTFLRGFPLYMYINNQQIFSEQILDKSIVNFYLIGINVYVLPITS